MGEQMKDRHILAYRLQVIGQYVAYAVMQSQLPAVYQLTDRQCGEQLGAGGDGKCRIRRIWQLFSLVSVSAGLPEDNAVRSRYRKHAGKIPGFIPFVEYILYYFTHSCVSFSIFI
jgi:hypothetical protein